MEAVVERIKDVPEAQEFLLKLRFVLWVEVDEKLLYGLDLVFFEESEVGHVLQVADVGKQLRCVGHVLIYIVEVADEHLAP